VSTLSEAAASLYPFSLHNRAPVLPSLQSCSPDCLRNMRPISRPFRRTLPCQRRSTTEVPARTRPPLFMTLLRPWAENCLHAWCGWGENASCEGGWPVVCDLQGFIGEGGDRKGGGAGRVPHCSVCFVLIRTLPDPRGGPGGGQVTHP
jgi:hypothetical protein